VLIEGTSERLLLPVMIGKLEEQDPQAPKLSSQYLTIMEVGGAYAHLFFELLDFLELRALIITDLDSVTEPGGTACPVHQGSATSNACLKAWFADADADADCSPAVLLTKNDAEKTRGFKRIAYQRPEADGGPCGRTFEDAFMLANAAMFDIQGATTDDQEMNAAEQAQKVKKSEFALKHAVDDRGWNSPGYVLDGLSWLAVDEPATRGADVAADANGDGDTASPDADDGNE